MTEKPTPDDYDADDGFDEEQGLDKCPHCDTTYSMNSSFYGPVWDQNGDRYETYVETDPTEGPWFCAHCWPELDTNRKQTEHKTLGEYQ